MGDFGVARDKWVCPNDRELSLRAKLKTGWSVKTNSINSFNKPEQLNDSEQEVIMSVIRRAETLDKVEQERIGRLVERLENMKKNAMGNGATQCVLCADEFGILGASPLVCNDCKKAVCTKCGVDTLSAHKDPVCLCKICAETRETWKKSGAWFYRGLPKYILPCKKSEPGKYSTTASPSKTPQRTWLQAKGSSENTDSSDEEFKCSRLAKRAAVRNSVDMNDSSDIPTESAGGPSPTHQYAPATPDPPHQHSPEGYPRAERKTAESEAATGRQIRGHNRKESQHSPVNRYRPVTGSNRADELFEDRPVSPEESSALEFSLLFDAHNQVLHCTIYRAKGLRPTDIDGLADPFIRLQLLPVQSKMDRLRTRTVHKTLNPEFNEALSFYGISDYDIAKRTLKMTVMDEDSHCNEAKGEIRIALKRLKPQQPSYANVYLEKPRAEEEDTCCGQILLALLYSEEHSALVVNVVRCVRLPSRENNGFPDPFVKVQLKPYSMRRRFKTSTKKKTLNPEYNEQYAFEVEAAEVTKKTIEVTVWDRDNAKQDIYIGGLALNMQSKGERLRHWLDMVRNPNRRIERWHSLSSVVFID